VFAAAAVGVTYGLAAAVLPDKWAAALAAVVIAASPLVVIQSGLLLAYLPTTVLLEAFIWALVCGLRLERPWILVVSGLALGLAAAARTYDAVLIALPLLAWAAASLARRRRIRA